MYLAIKARNLSDTYSVFAIKACSISQMSLLTPGKERKR